jgi:tellurite resistance protein TehA-like permease
MEKQISKTEQGKGASFLKPFIYSILSSLFALAGFGYALFLVLKRCAAPNDVIAIYNVGFVGFVFPFAGLVFGILARQDAVENDVHRSLDRPARLIALVAVIVNLLDLLMVLFSSFYY